LKTYFVDLLIDVKCCTALLVVCGAMVNGPYCLITTAVSADLGTHPSLQGNKMALATVTAIIDGTGSMGIFSFSSDNRFCLQNVHIFVFFL